MADPSDGLYGGLAGMGGDIVSAGIGYVGQQQTNAANISAAEGMQQQNEAFQEYMSDTAHQREVTDLKAAGLNPILSATGGSGAGGGSAGQAAPEITSPTEAVSSSVKQMATHLADLRSTDAETKVKLNQAKLIDAQTANAKREGRIKESEAKVGDWASGLESGVNKHILEPLSMAGGEMRRLLQKHLGYQPKLTGGLKSQEPKGGKDE